jgi:hypothetical protein
MTAVNVLLTKDAVHVLTDCLASDETGTHILAKAWPLPHLNAVVAVRGVYHAALAFIIALSRTGPTSLDELISRLSDLEEIVTNGPADEWMRKAWGDAFDLVVAGWGARGPAAYLVSNNSWHGNRPWEVKEIEHFVFLPLISNFAEIIVSRDPVAKFPLAVDSQRQSKPEMIGGAAQLTTVTADMITTRIVRDWRA